jgi:FtsP/CotA-like multicopper oxidase with cupredoxin domain
MDDKSSTRRQFLKTAGIGTAGVVAAGSGFAAAARGGGRAARTVPGAPDPTYANELAFGLAATDGHIILPNRPGGRPVYIFGFIHVPTTSDVNGLATTYKGQAQHPAPILGFRQNSDIRIALTNLGFVARPDLTDSHTIHWHGFRAPVAVMDGVPEVSIAVPNQRQFTYFYRPHDPGTYMYHCHFEDVEHVQMGMTSIVFVRPLQGDNFVYNDGNGSTAFHREFAILLNEIWTLEHDHDEDIQESVHTDYKPDYFTLNGRVYPQTVLPSMEATLPGQPISSLVQCNGPGASRYAPATGDIVLLRLANLGYQQHAMQLPGISMKVVGEDATLLRGPSGADLTYTTNTLYMGPGEARDVLFTAPAYDAARGVLTDAFGNYNRYFFKNRSAWKLSNNGAPGLGGMATEVRVYQNTLPAQTAPNQTYA